MDRDVRLGGPLFQSKSPVLLPFLTRRKEILSVQLSGIASSSAPDQHKLSLLQDDIDYLEQKINKLQQQEDLS